MKNLGHELHEQGWRSIGIRLVVGLLLLSAVVWFGRHAGQEIKTMEAWVADHGLWGRIVFVCMMVVLASVFVPDSLFGIAGGAMFGLVWGTVLIVAGAVLTAALNFLLAREFLRPRIEKMLEQKPKLRAIRQAADRKGFRLQLLLRLAPINPVSVSYVLGAAGGRFSTFMLATVAMVPGLFMEVYFGYMASHLTKVAGEVSDHSEQHTVVTVAGFALCAILMIVITRMVTKALAEAEGEPAETSPGQA